MPNPLPLALLPLVQEAPAAAAGFGGTDGPDLTRYATVCVLLIVAIAGVAWGFKRLVAGNLRTRANQRSLQVLDVLPLGGKQRLAVVRCYDRTFALGLGDKEVTAIAELDPVTTAPDEASEPREAGDRGPGAQDRTFQRALAHVQDALSKTRAGVGPAKPLRAQAAPSAERRTAVAQLLDAVSHTADARPARRAATSKANTDANTNQAASARRATEPAPAAQAAARPAADQEPRPARPKRATRKAAPKKAAAPRADERPAGDAPARRARRRPEKAAAPRAQARPAATPTLGLEGVMG